MATLSSVLEQLNPEQHQAVTSSSHKTLVMAGAGSGKTSVLTARIAYLQERERVGTSNMLALTFTRLAAAEMKERVGKLLGEQQAKKLTAGTFHSFCAQVLRQWGEQFGLSSDFSIYDQEDREAILAEIITDLRLANKVRASAIEPWALTSEPYEKQVISEYRYRLQRNNATDLDGLLYLTKTLLEEHEDIAHKLRERFTHVFVDEYQDTDATQEAILQAINPHNLFVVGDPSQAIYGWRGAEIENILTFTERHPDAEVVRLERNYRSTTEILDLANQVISKAEHKSPLQLWTDKTGSYPKLLHSKSDLEESQMIAAHIEMLDTQWSDIAILCRTNWQVTLYDTALKLAGIPAYLIAPRNDEFNSYDVRRIIDHIAWLSNPKDERAFRHIVNWRYTRLTDTEMLLVERAALQANENPLEALIEASGLREEAQPPMEAWTSMSSLWEWVCDDWLRPDGIYAAHGLTNRKTALDNATNAIDDWELTQAMLGEATSPQAFLTWLRTRDVQERLMQQQADGGVNILTVHAAKGLEWEHVIVPGCNQNIFPSRRGDPEEERRLFYVAVTRAKETLWLSYADERTSRDGYRSQVKPSPYLSDIWVTPPRACARRRRRSHRPGDDGHSPARVCEAAKPNGDQPKP